MCCRPFFLLDWCHNCIYKKFVKFISIPNTELCCYTHRYAKEVCDAIVAKCLTGRPKTVEKAQAVFMLWVELEAVDAFLVCAFSRMFCVFNNLV